MFIPASRYLTCDARVERGLHRFDSLVPQFLLLQHVSILQLLSLLQILCHVRNSRQLFIFQLSNHLPFTPNPLSQKRIRDPRFPRPLSPVPLCLSFRSRSSWLKRILDSTATNSDTSRILLNTIQSLSARISLGKGSPSHEKCTSNYIPVDRKFWQCSSLTEVTCNFGDFKPKRIGPKSFKSKPGVKIQDSSNLHHRGFQQLKSSTSFFLAPVCTCKEIR